MTITLSPETMKLLEDRMRMRGFDNPDDAVRDALQDIEDLDVDRSPETLAAIRQGMADAEAGRSRPWADFEKDWMARNAKK